MFSMSARRSRLPFCIKAGLLFIVYFYFTSGVEIVPMLKPSFFGSGLIITLIWSTPFTSVYMPLSHIYGAGGSVMLGEKPRGPDMMRPTVAFHGFYFFEFKLILVGLKVPDFLLGETGELDFESFDLIDESSDYICIGYRPNLAIACACLAFGLFARTFLPG